MNSVVKRLSRALALGVAVVALGGSAFAGAPAPDCNPCPSVPEIDPGSAAGALTLLVGGALSLADRRRSK
jgi:hypothetical protein